MDAPLVSYLSQAGRGQPPSGMRVLPGGQAELKQGRDDWRQVAHLSAAQIAQLHAMIAEAAVFELPAEIAAPAGLRADAVCVWEANLAGRSAHVTVRGWSDENPGAAPLRRLVGQIFELTQAAQLGGGVP